MRARRLWLTWAHLALIGVVALEVFAIWFADALLVPKFQKLALDGVIDLDFPIRSRTRWMGSFLDGLHVLVSRYGFLLLTAAVALGGLFEWRVRGENKPLIRLSALGTAALGLLALTLVTAAALVIPCLMSGPITGRLAEPFAGAQVAFVGQAADRMEQALAKRDWASVTQSAKDASQSVQQLRMVSAALGTLRFEQRPGPGIEEIRDELTQADERLAEVERAAGQEDAPKAEAALRGFRARFEPIARAAKKI